ncbi:MAG: hypothetical protein E7391_08935 [Ruminococcaceae bacterium]|nr:hypothetical protein [Oscillospiraceae bacterium]
MKKVLALILSFMMIVSCFSCIVFADNEIKITLNGTALTMDQPPIIVEGRTLVPVRAIFEALGATVTWDDATKTATGVLGGTTVSLQINNTQAKVNGLDVTLDVPAQIVNSRTLVPVRFISESLGCKVDWDDATKTVIIEGESGPKLYKKWDFNNLESFENNKDFIVGGAYPASFLSISDKYDANGNGKALLLANREQPTHRIKLKNVFTKEDLGKTFTIKAKVLTPDQAGNAMVGVYSDTKTKYATVPIINKNVTTNKNEWTNVEFTYVHTDEIADQLGFGQRDGASLVKTLVIDDIEIYEGAPETNESLSNWTFDNLSSFENNKDFICGAAYPHENVSLSNEFDHTTGNGKSLKMTGRTKIDHRVKLLGAFNPNMVGKIYKVTAWVYFPDAEGTIVVGAYSDTGTTYAFDPVSSKAFKVKQNEWTLVEFQYQHKEAIVTQVGFDQKGTSTCIKTIFVDDVKIEEIDKITDESILDAVKSVKVTDGHRPVPTNFTTGKGFDDLIYFESDKASNEELVARLPEGKVAIDDSLVLGNVDKMVGKQYGSAEIIDVNGMPFTKAVRVNVHTIPETNPYAIQFDYGAPLEGKAQVGDKMLLKVYMRTENGGLDEAQNGQIQVIIEENGGGYDKSVAGNISNGSDWNVFYFPFEFIENRTRATIRLGYAIQTVDIGGYTITNYGSDIDIKELPTDSGSEPSLKKDAAWRKEAWDRIEKIRKGDIKVIVKDSAGNVIPNAEVKVNMYEHEFAFGTAVHGSIYADEMYRSVVQTNFNAAVPENQTKWVEHEKAPDKTVKMYESLIDLGIKNLRGHVLVWDRDEIDDNGKWEDNTSIPEDLTKLYGDRAKMQERIAQHIDEITSKTNPFFSEWDVLNEACNNKVMQDMYGREIINEWFDMARKALGKDAMLYYNDFKTGNELFTLLDTMYANNVDFDGIGIQSHYVTATDPVKIYDFYEQLYTKYGKRLKITEYDFATSDQLLQANFTRDLLITAFSHEAVDGFLMWGIKAGPNNKYVLYDSEWNPKLALTSWQDLIYNKWWTEESGTTDNNGEFTTRGFYGDYDITVTANGKTKTVSTPCYKGNDNTITITLD